MHLWIGLIHERGDKLSFLEKDIRVKVDNVIERGAKVTCSLYTATN